MPILLTALPFLGNSYLSHTTEIIIVVLSILIALGIQTKDYSSHKNKFPLVLIFVACLFFLLAFFGFNGSLETILSPVASFIMAASFLLNWKLHRSHCSNHSH